MASKSDMESVEEQVKKIVLVMNNGNEIQQHLERKQSRTDERLSELQARMEERQSHIESKLDRMMQIMTEGVANTERGDINSSFIEEDNSIPLGIVLDDNKGTTTQIPNCTVATHIADGNRIGKFSCFTNALWQLYHIFLELMVNSIWRVVLPPALIVKKFVEKMSNAINMIFTSVTKILLDNV